MPTLAVVAQGVGALLQDASSRGELSLLGASSRGGPTPVASSMVADVGRPLEVQGASSAAAHINGSPLQ